MVGGKLGNKGRRKEKIAVACFNILFISKHCGLQKAEAQSAPVPGSLFLLFSYEHSRERSLIFFSLSAASFVEPPEQYIVKCRKRSKLRFLFFESGLCTSSVLIFW